MQSLLPKDTLLRTYLLYSPTIKLWKLCTLKPDYQRGLTVKMCNNGQSVSTSTGFTVKKGILLIYLYFKARARINTADNKKKLAGAVSVFASIVLDNF